MRTEFENFCTVVDVRIVGNSIIAHDGKSLTWDSLEVSFYHRSDTEVITTIRSNNVTKKDLMNLSKMFKEMAETMS